MIDRENLFDQSVKNNLWTYNNIKKITISEWDDYTTGYFLDYNYFKNYYKMITIDLSKKQALNADKNAIQQINFIGTLNQGENKSDNITMFFIVEEGTETILDFPPETVRTL